MTRIYTLREVLRALCKAQIPSPDRYNDRPKCLEQHLAIGDFNDIKRWRLVSLPLEDLASMHVGLCGLFLNARSRVEKYAALRRAGSPFPPILVSEYKPGKVNYPDDGSHRVAAAQMVGDSRIDAFIPYVRDHGRHV